LEAAAKLARSCLITRATMSEAAKYKDDYVIYNKKTGVLSYDVDGSGSKAAVEFAQLRKGLALTYKDFFVI
jgi:16S rRNA U516 pseudouridylate synthase RsuA-like enzyme